jgi:Putative manganese efflux pump
VTPVVRLSAGEPAPAAGATAGQGRGRDGIRLADSRGGHSEGALGTYHVALLTAAVLIGAVSVTMALIGLELGRLLGTKIGERGEALGGIMLAVVGIAIATGLL